LHSAARCHSLRVALRFPDPTLVTGRDANARQANSSVLGGFRECRRVVALCCLCRSSLLKFGIQKCRVLSAAHGYVCTRVVCCVSCCLISPRRVSCRVVSCRCVSCRCVSCCHLSSPLVSSRFLSSLLLSPHFRNAVFTLCGSAVVLCVVLSHLASSRVVSCRCVLCCHLPSPLVSFRFLSSLLLSPHFHPRTHSLML